MATNSNKPEGAAPKMTVADLQKILEEQKKLMEAQADTIDKQGKAIAELSAANEAAVADAEAATKATEAETTVPADVLENETKMQKMVKIKLFKDNGKYKDDVFVAVNGKAYQIQRGKEVEVPLFVKEVLDSSMTQDQYAASYSEMLSGNFEKVREHLE